MSFRRFLQALTGKSKRFPWQRNLSVPSLRLEALESRFNPADLFYPNITPALGGIPTQLLSVELNGDGNPDVAALTDQSITVILGNGKGQFFQPRSIDLGLPIFSIAGADLNGDGRTDLAAVSWQTNSVSILLNKGDGTFQAPLALGVGGQPTSIAFADFNGDGKTDLAVSNYTGKSLTVYLGNGNGTFGLPRTIPVGETPYKLVSGDFNNDGKVDLACALYNPGSLSVLSGNGNGTFQSALETKIGASPLTLAAGDLNGDKRTDIVCVFDKNSTGSVLLFQGNGPFSSASVNLGTNPTDIRLADLNGDGKLDLVTSNQADNGLSFALNKGDGTFQANQWVEMKSQQYCVSSGDFNKDGKTDLLTSGLTGGATTLFLGNGDATFQKGSSLGTGGSPYSLFSADFNNDGQADYVTANYGSNTISILLGNADAGFQPARIMDLGSQTGSVIGRDFNSDGKLDLVVTLTGANQIALLFGNGNGTFQAPQLVEAGQGPGIARWADMDGDLLPDLVVTNQDLNVSIFYSQKAGNLLAAQNWTTTEIPGNIDIADLNGDGINDIVVTDGFSNNLEILYGKGKQSLPSGSLKLGTGAKPVSVRAADFNGDGLIDIATVNQGDNTVGILFQIPDKSFSKSVSFPTGIGPQESVCADFNNDGAIDLAITNNLSGTISVLINNQKGSFLPAVQYQAVTGAFSIIATDNNRDGQLDLVCTSYSEKNLNILLGNGNGSFRGPQLVSVGTKPQSITTGDFNKDGKLDWVTANNSDNTLSIALGNGTGTFGLPRTLATGSKPVSVIAADFNNDGKPDLASANSGDFSLSVHLGNGDGTFQSYSTISLADAPDKLAFGDFNKDGKIDLITTNHEGKNLELLLGLGDGSFQNPQPIPLENAPLTLTIADFNKDGNPDIATAQFDSQKVAILLGNGNGSFKSPTFVNLAVNPWSISSGDFNGDGKVDLVASHPDLNTVSVLMGNGNGTFQAPQSVNVGPLPYFVTTADLNRDGKSDLISANYWKGSISVLLSKGASGFEAAKQYRTGGSPIELAIADFNGDQKPDIVTADNESGTVSILSNSPAYLSLVSTGPLVYGSGVTFSARIASANTLNPPTGQITFKKGNTVLGTRPLVLTGGEYIATLSLPGGLPVGKQNDLVAQYSGDAKNQSLISAPVIFEIQPKTLTLVFTATNKVYDGTTKANVSLAMSGAIGNDAVSVTYAVAEFGDKNVGNGKTITVSGISIKGVKAGNYRVEPVLSTKAAITPKGLTIKALSTQIVYGNLIPILQASYSGFVTGESQALVTGLKLTTTALQTSKVGSYTITASGATAPNYQIGFLPGLLTINRAALSILPDDKTKVYGAPLPNLTARFIGLVNGESPAVITGLKLASTASQSSKVGDYSISVSGGIATNYNITYLVGSFKVTKAPLAIQAENKTKVYGVALPTLTTRFTGLTNGDTPTAISGLKLATIGLASSPVGDYPITLTVGNSSNYEITLTPGTLTVNPASLIIAADNKNKIYGDNNPILSAKFTGLVNGDAASVISGLKLGTQATQFSHVGNYSITPSDAVASNYTIKYTNGALSINRKAVSFTIPNQTRTYGSPVNLNPVVINPISQASSIFTLSSFDITAFKTRFTFLLENSGVTDQLADGFTFTIQGNGPTSLGSSGEGLGFGGMQKSIAVKFDLFDNNGEGNNSTGLFVDGATPSSLAGSINLNGTAINLQAQRKISAELTYLNKNLIVVLTDLQTGKTARQTYAVDIASHIGGSRGYLGFTAGTGGFTARQSILEWSTQDAKGASLFAFKDFTGAKGLAFNGNAIVKGSTLVLTCANKALDIPTGINQETLSLALQSDGNTALATVGIYALKGVPFDGTGQLADYDLKLNDGKLIVEKAVLTITADKKSKVYGAVVPPLTVTYAGFVNGESSKVLSGLKIGTSALTTSKVGDYQITPSQAVAANYSIRFEEGILTVTKAQLTITAENKSRLSGKMNPPLTATFTGLVNGDSSSVVTGLVLSTSATATSTPGLYTITASGGLAANYSIQYIDGTLAINQAPTITSPNSTTFTKGQTNTFALTATGFPTPTFKIILGTLPGGLILNATTGVLSGNPTAPPGIYTFLVSASNGIGINPTQSFTLTVS